MATENRVTRRGLLAAGTAGLASAAGVVALAAGSGTVLSGCGDDACERWSEEYEPRAATGPSSLAGRPIVAVLADIPIGRAVTARTPEGEPIIVSRPDAETAVAFSAKCTHNGCVINPDGERLWCPPHDGYFEAATGKPQDGPPKKPLRRVAVEVADGKVVLAA